MPDPGIPGRWKELCCLYEEFEAHWMARSFLSERKGLDVQADRCRDFAEGWRILAVTARIELAKYEAAVRVLSRESL